MVLTSVSQSSDHNSIENLWEELKLNVHSKSALSMSYNELVFIPDFVFGSLDMMLGIKNPPAHPPTN